MQTSDFDYNLPQELIAQYPVFPRDHSRLLVVDKKNNKLLHKHFYNIIDYLQSGDLLVWNNSKVFKARLFGRLEPAFKVENNPSAIAQGKQELLEHKKPVEIFLIREMENEGVWKVLAKPGRHVGPGMRVVFAPSTSSLRGDSVEPGQASDFYCDVMIKEKDGTILVQFPDSAEVVREKANKYGHIPVPPYVKDEPDQIETYQTVYAKPEGSVAAPTAGFHFTSELIEKLKNKGIEFAEVTLHVGLGTFLPVKSERVEDHTMHSEWVELSPENAEKINRAKKEGRRVVAVGTTTVRTLEGIAQFMGHEADIKKPFNHSTIKPLNNNKIEINGDNATHIVRSYSGDINIFITPACHDLQSGMSGRPGFEFKVVDAMITNFHLPKSTLLMLVSAFIGGRQKTLDIYNEAVKEKYRFYSFGDAMFIK